MAKKKKIFGEYNEVNSGFYISPIEFYKGAVFTEDDKDRFLEGLRTYDYAANPYFGEAYKNLGEVAYDFAHSCWNDMAAQMTTSGFGSIAADPFNAEYVKRKCTELNKEKGSQALDKKSLDNVIDLVLLKFDEMSRESENIDIKKQNKLHSQFEPAKKKELSKPKEIPLLDLSEIIHEEESVAYYKKEILKAYAGLFADEHTELFNEDFRQITEACWDKIIQKARNIASTEGAIINRSDIAVLCGEANQERAIHTPSLHVLSDKTLENIKCELLVLLDALTAAYPILCPPGLKDKDNIKFITLAKISDQPSKQHDYKATLVSANHVFAENFPQEYKDAYYTIVTQCWNEMIRRTTLKQPRYKDGFSINDIFYICEKLNNASDKPFERDILNAATVCCIQVFKSLADKQKDLKAGPYKPPQIGL